MFGLFKKREKKYRDIAVDEFKKLSNSGNTVILDVRTQKEANAASIPGGININVMGPFFKKEIAALDKSKTYLIYCKSGMRSGRACRIMSKNGFEHLYNLEGGILAWNADK